MPYVKTVRAVRKFVVKKNGVPTFEVRWLPTSQQGSGGNFSYGQNVIEVRLLSDAANLVTTPATTDGSLTERTAAIGMISGYVLYPW